MSSCAPTVSIVARDEPRARPRPSKVLTIDDDPYLCQALKRRLARFDVELYQACCGIHGVFLAKTHQPDVIVTDMRMPQGEGQHVVAWLKECSQTRHIPVIVLTGLDDRRLEEHVRSLGAEEYLRKPVPFETLCSAMRRFVPLLLRTDPDEGVP